MQHVVTLVSNPHNPLITDDFINVVISKLDASSHSVLSRNTAIDIVLPPSQGQNQALQTLQTIIADLPIDIVIQNQNTRRKKALIADMDSTMIDQECIDELAAEVGVKDRVSQITAKAMNGEIEFDSALRERVALLEGLPEDVYLEVIKKRITLASGGKTLIATLKANSVHCALVSGGFTLFTNPIANMLGFDENRANILEIKNGLLTGKVVEPILGAQAKVDALNDIATTKSLDPTDFIAVGDGANDLPMLQLAGTGVALHAKPSVAEQAKIKINHGDLTALLYVQGYSDSEIIHDATL